MLDERFRRIFDAAFECCFEGNCLGNDDTGNGTESDAESLVLEDRAAASGMARYQAMVAAMAIITAFMLDAQAECAEGKCKSHYDRYDFTPLDVHLSPYFFWAWILALFDL